MVRDRYIKLLNKPQDHTQEDTLELKSTIKKYPYFQSARILYLKALKDANSFKYNNELKITAAYTADRSVLFDFITSKVFHEISIEKESVTEEKAIHKPSDENVTQAELTTQELEIGKPFNFNKSETHSFQQWLQLSGTIQTVKSGISPKKKTLQDNIIDRFISSNPKIPKVNKHQPLNAKSGETRKEPSLMTETLAKIYLEQKKYENAIKAYEILSLKYPEKSGFFADQIKKIRILQNIK